ncbi:MAG: hypothetical protein HOF72_07900, partial [Planctomycetaceae bacterium]|nr:hypothetical protein [Planctomycetaceae bacterium]
RNKNGVVELEEIPVKHVARIKAMDSNGDGELTVSELNAYIKRVLLQQR